MVREEQQCKVDGKGSADRFLWGLRGWTCAASAMLQASRASPFQVLILLLATALVLVGAGCSMHSSYCPAKTVAQVSVWGDSASTQGSNASHGRRLESSSGSWKPYVRRSTVIGKS